MQAAKFEALRLEAVVINAETLRADPNIWAKARAMSTVAILLSPEMLTSRAFKNLLEHEAFRSRVAILAVDEVHLLLTWGLGFRQAFNQIGLLQPRLHRETRIVALTASLLPGEVDSCLQSLGLKRSDVFIARRSNLRGNVLLERKVLKSFSGPNYSELHWLVSSNKKVILFCGTLATAWKVAEDVVDMLEPSTRRARLRIYAAFFGTDYNAETRRLLADTRGGMLVLATSAFSVGIDVPFVDIVAVMETITSPHMFIQEPGRVARGDRTRRGRGIIFVTKAMLDKAQKIVANGVVPPARGKSRKTKEEDGMTLDVAKILVAEVMEDALDDLYGNPVPSVCRCQTCGGVPISGHPDLSSRQKLSELLRSIGESVKTSQPPRRPPPVPGYTKAMRAHVVACLQKFRIRVWLRMPSNANTVHIDPTQVLDDDEIAKIADKATTLDTLEKVQEIICELDLPLLRDHAVELLETLKEALVEARAEFNQRHAEGQAKRALTMAAKRKAKVDSASAGPAAVDVSLCVVQNTL